MRINVIGAGLAGSWLTRVARDAGHDVALYDDPRPTPTLAAIALLRSTHLPAADRPLLAPSLEAWRASGVEVLSGGTFSRWDRTGDRLDADWFAVDPADCLVPADYSAYFTHATAPTDADVTVWCDGSGPGRVTYGYTWIAQDPAALRTSGPLTVHMLAPYKVLVAVRYATHARIGSSSATTEQAAFAQAQHHLEVALNRGWIASPGGWELVGGHRLLREPARRFLRVSQNVWAWSGFHRTGFGVVPAETHTVLARIAGGAA